MFAHIVDHLRMMENDLSITSRDLAIARLRLLGISDFMAVLWSMPDPQFPKLSKLLPRMANEDIPRSWTGYCGFALLNQTIGFYRSLSANYSELTGGTLRHKRILDFGCGYGRLLRMTMFYTDQTWGVDPWNESIRLCNEAGLTENVVLSDYLPVTLPVPHDFDCVFAFSVFTHLSERATKTNLSAIRTHIKPGSIACITIRPVEYWRQVYPGWPVDSLEKIERDHREKGFVFVPHDREPVDGDITYGDTSMSLDWLSRIVEGWEIRATDRNLDDPMQRFVFLQAI